MYISRKKKKAKPKSKPKPNLFWHGTFGMDAFSDEEFEKLLEYAKFIKSLREK